MRKDLWITEKARIVSKNKRSYLVIIGDRIALVPRNIIHPHSEARSLLDRDGSMVIPMWFAIHNRLEVYGEEYNDRVYPYN